MNEDVNFIRGRAAEVSDVALTPEERGQARSSRPRTRCWASCAVCRSTWSSFPPAWSRSTTPRRSRRPSASAAARAASSRAPSQARAGQHHHRRHLHRRRLPGPQGHPRQRRPGRRRGGRGADAGQQPDGQGRAHHLLHRPGEVLGLPHLRRALPAQRDHVRRGEGVAEVIEAACKGCGVCVAACGSNVPQQRGFLDDQIFAEIEGALAV